MRFPGQRYDSASGISYNYFRDYDSSVGRYMESDPIGLRGGLSTYGYVKGSPLNRFDSSGLLVSAQTGTIVSGENTVVCDGKGGMKVFLDDRVLYSDYPCLIDCARVHEQTHLNDALRISPNACLGDVDRTGIFWDDADRLASERNAHAAERSCLKSKLRNMNCDDKCKQQIEERLQEVDVDLLPYYQSGRDPYTTNPRYNK
ncbi:RHS repeat-associated core domain-containing protein [Lysobacter sp. CA199]|uniref:RHS repeat-associated core domain-containing protein n=1 Tax=Lysobacter sp. CA199 TaxID=3455608 RepID=UPI003F8D2FB4